MNKRDQTPLGPELHKAFLTHLSRNYERIRGFIQVMLADPADVEDLMQETVLILWRKYESFDPQQSFSAWGIGVAKRCILRLHEKKHRDATMFRPEVLHAIAKHEAVFSERFDERVQALNACIQKLSESDRKMLHLRYQQNLSIKNIGEQLQRPAHGLYRSLGRISQLLLNCVRRRLALEQY